MALLTTGPEEHSLVLVVHHIAADGESIRPLLTDLLHFYQEHAEGTSADGTAGEMTATEPRPVLPVQYADYTLWQKTLLGDEKDPTSLAARQLEYWKNNLRDLPDTLPLPYDHPRPTTATHHGQHITFPITPELHQQLKNLAHTHNTSLFMVLQAAVATLLTRLGAGTDIPLGTPTAGRTDTTLHNLIGFFVNTLILRINTSGNPTYLDILHRTKETALNAYNNQDLPFELLVEHLNPTRTLAHHPLFQTMLTLQENPQPTHHTPHLTAQLHTTPTNIAKFDLTIALIENTHPNGQPNGITGYLEYATDLFTHHTAQTLTTRLTNLLHTITQNPHTPIHHINTLTPQEHQQLT
ncbi:condensation domain-containing protein, partial [Streptomyces sp. NPDC006798]|uniref:condensation domain-containing protein n=1 Tax=Streptomyces sp. NPDC006798 TaxID=3155462 RepID=UPI0033F14ACB